MREQIKWTPIKYFNNKIVCDLIEERRPPGIFAALNDACATAHADPTAADNSFIQRMAALSSNAHFDSRGAQFIVKHYAGDVTYNVAGMTDKNKDLLVKDLLDLIGTSGNQFLQGLFPDRPDPNNKKCPPTAGDRIKVCFLLVTKSNTIPIEVYYVTGFGGSPRREFNESSTFLHSYNQAQPEP